MELKIRKLFFTRKFLNSITHQNDLNRLLIIQMHHAVIYPNGHNFILSHLNQFQTITLFNQNIDLIPYFVSNKDIFNTGKSQHITGPGFDFKNVLDPQAIEIHYYSNPSKIQNINNFLETNYDNLRKITNQISEKQGVLLLDEKTKSFNQLIAFKEYKKNE